MIRWLFLTHRYLGIAVGLIMAMWCLSGIVMMYVQYPELDERERLASLTPLNFQTCCRLPPGALETAPPFTGFRIQMLAGTPVLQLQSTNPRWVGPRFDLARGEALGAPAADRIRQAAQSWQDRAGVEGSLSYQGALYNDQWTVYAAYDPHRPLHRFAAGDAAGTEWYVSGTTGEIVQVTTAHQRFWNWLGAVAHWLYPTQLRQHTAVWAQVVIWLTFLGLFLTVIGLYIGVSQYKTRSNGRLSPYRGASLWHHYSGLVFGILVLSWVVSGLFSMNPWGLLEGESAAPERNRLHEQGLDPATVQRFIERLDPAAGSNAWVRLEGRSTGGEFAVLALDGQGGKVRMDERLENRPLSPGHWDILAARLQPDTTVADAGLLHGEDSYYYDHHEKRDYPVYRIVFDDPGRTRYYLDAVSGELLLKVDAERRWYRWLHYGLHRGDFSGFLRSRPVWDLFMLMLMSGVTVSCLTGAWMGWRRLTRNRRQRAGQRLPTT